MFEIGMTLMMQPSSDQEKYRSKLVDVKESNWLIDYPINQATGKLKLFLEGTRFTISFVGKDQSVYTFETEILSRKKEGNIPVLEISYPGDGHLTKIQRREFVRVETAVDVAVHSVHGEFSPFTAITADVSAGGAALVLPQNHRLVEGNLISCYFVLPLSNGEYHYVNVKCNVIRIIPGRNKRDKAPVQFVDLTEKDRHAFVKLCFDRQLAEKREV